MERLEPTADAVARWLGPGRRLLLAGSSGSGKSTLLRALADLLGHPAVTADPGRPELGPPGALARGHRRDGRWHLDGLEGLATLDANRFRLPLAQAARRLCAPPGPLLIDAPGVDRGAGAAELLSALAALAAVDRVLWLGDPPGAGPPEALAALAALGIPMAVAPVPPEARAPSPAERRRERTARWDRWLAGSTLQKLDGVRIVGTPPPGDLPAAWVGRQAVLRDSRGETLTVGEIVALDAPEGRRLVVRAPAASRPPASVVVRDARRVDGLLRTARHHRHPRAPRRDLRGPLPLPGPSGAASSRLQATLLGGVLGDPTLQLRHTGRPSALLLDLGDVGPLHPGLAHHLTHLLLSHAHLDHVSGLVRLVRQRVGFPDPVVVLGPPGVAERVRAALSVATWDRVGPHAPAFRVGEIGAEFLRWTHLRAGERPVPGPAEPRAGRVVHRDEALTIEAQLVDHGGLPVVAWAVEEPEQVRIRRDGLDTLGLPPGPWLAALRRALARDERSAPIALPDGRTVAARELEAPLTVRSRGRRLVYVTDVGDTPDNRARLVRLVRGADLLVCEAPFLHEERERAAAVGHLTARAAAELAADAGVGLLAPFHLSQRHADRLDAVYDEIRSVFPQVWDPRRPRGR